MRKRTLHQQQVLSIRYVRVDRSRLRPTTCGLVGVGMTGAHGGVSSPRHWRPVNQDWPQVASARAIPYAPVPLTVEVRVEWPDGSQGWVGAKAVRWCGRRVHVRWHDLPRCGGTVNVWMHAKDIRRLAPSDLVP